jgi:L-threonylcarbamoyladenylate synthase
MTVVVRVDAARPDDASIRMAADCLRDGGLVAFPTETVYGLGVHALDAAAVRRLFAAKGRPANDPLIVHVTSLSALPAIVSRVPPSVSPLGARFWPGPLTIVLPRGDGVPTEVTAGRDTVAVRVPAHPVARAILAAAAVPVAAPSANLFSRPSPTRAEHVVADLGGRIDLVIDAGPTTVGVESTVLDLTGSVARVLRPGAVTIEMLREVLPDVEDRAPDSPALDETAAMASPGLLSRHYAPRTPLVLYARGEWTLPTLARDTGAALADGRAVGLLLTEEDRIALGALGAPLPDGRVWTLGEAADLAGIASRLYAALRELDAAGLDLILAAELPATGGLGFAIADRLRRAAHEHRTQNSEP